MRFLMTFEEAAATLNAELMGKQSAAGFCGVCIDSREAKPGFLFAALKGEATDGHRFVESAFQNGAACALVENTKVQEFKLDELVKNYNALLLIVRGNTLAAFQELAMAYLKKFPALLRVGITGSSGKTTTKEIFASIAGQEKNIAYNSGNFNSETGLPISVFNIKKENELGIFEAAMNHPGEIAALAGILKPQIALITNIGTAHIGFIGSKKGIALEKKAIFSEFTGSETAVIPKNDEFAELLAENIKGKVHFFDEKAEIGRMQAKNLGLDGWELDIEGVKARFPLPGEHNLRDAVAAIELAKIIKIAPSSIRAGLEAVRPLFGRSEIFKGRQTVVRDCYNANPQSMSEAISLCASLDWPGRKVYVLAPMRELGEESANAHRELGRLLIALKAELVFLFAEETLDTYKILMEAQKYPENPENRTIPKLVFHTNDIEELKTLLRAHIRDGDLVLLKGSHSCALERVGEVFSIPV